nr:hypothetical protein [Tanacetum cinerariifolium]
GTQRAHVDAGARVEHVGEQKANDDGNRGNDFEVQNRLQTDATELFRVPHTCDADNQRRDHDRDDDHLDQADKDVTRWLEDITD